MSSHPDNPPDPSAEGTAHAPRRMAFVLIAAFILIAPAMPQLFGINSPFFRPWTMFSGVGVGLLKGTFTEVAPDGTTRAHDPQAVLGVTRYELFTATPPAYLVHADEHLSRVTARFCADLPEGSRLRYSGWRQTRRGWVPLTSDDVCGPA